MPKEQVVADAFLTAFTKYLDLRIKHGPTSPLEKAGRPAVNKAFSALLTDRGADVTSGDGLRLAEGMAAMVESGERTFPDT